MIDHPLALLLILSSAPYLEIVLDKTHPEYKISAKWDRCIERFFINVGVGAVAGAVSGLLLARGKGGRMLITGIGTGWGAGSAYEACSRAFSVDDSE